MAASLSSQKVRLNKLRCKEEKKNELKQIRPLINSRGRKTHLKGRKKKERKKKRKKKGKKKKKERGKKGDEEEEEEKKNNDLQPPIPP